MKEFTDIYKEIKNASENIQALYKKDLIIKIILSIIVLSFALFFIHLLDLAFYTHIIILLALILIFTFFYKFHLPSYKEAYKKDIISKMIEVYDPNFKYSSHSLINPTIYCEGNFEQNFDKFHSEDGIQGMFRGEYPFLMGEVKTIKVDTYTDSEGKTHRSEYTIFNGFFIRLSTTISLPCTIYIRKKYPFSRKLSISNKNFISQNMKHPETEEIQMDDSEFEKLYYIETDNQMLTMQLFTLSALSELIEFKKIYKLTPEFTIKNNTIFIRFHMKGRIFEPPMLRSPLSYTELQKEYKFVTSIMKICENMIDAIHNLEL